MPLLTTESFPTQIKSNFKIISEFLNISASFEQSVWKNFIFSNDCFIFATVRLNKIIIFLKKMRCFALFNIIRNDSTKISLLKISISGSKFSFFIKQKTIIVFKLSKKPLYFSKDNPRYFFNKVLEFSCETDKPVRLISSCFNNDENRVFLSFSNGKILFLDFNGKISSILKMENPVFDINPAVGIKSELEFYGILNKQVLINYNVITNKHRNFKKSRMYVIKKFYVMLLKKNTIEISCNCHGKILKSIIIPRVFKKILLIENNKIIAIGNSSLILLNLDSFFLKSTKVYHFNKSIFHGKLFRFKNQFENNKYNGTFSLKIIIKSNIYIEVKPLTEKVNFFINSHTIILKNNQISIVRFFGKKNSILVGTHLNSITIFNGNCFRFIGTFSGENNVISEIILKGNLLLIANNFHEIIFINLVSLVLLEKGLFPDKISTGFSFSKENKSSCFLTCGFKDGTLKTWNVMLYRFKKIQLKLLWVKKISEDTITFFSVSSNFKFIASLTKKNTVFLLNLLNKDLITKIKSPEKAICCIKFCPKSEILCTGTEYGSIIFFGISDNNFSKINKGDGASVLNFDFNVKGTILIASFNDGIVKMVSIFNSSTYTVFGNHSKPIWGCGFSEDEHIITGCSGGKLVILKDISFENSKKQNEKFSRIFFLKKSLKLKKFNQNFKLIFEKIIFTKNSYMLIDFLEFSYKKNAKNIQEIFSKTVKNSKINELNFTLKSLILFVSIKKKQIFIYKVMLTIFESLQSTKILNINFSILKGAIRLLEEWIVNVKNLQKK